MAFFFQAGEPVLVQIERPGGAIDMAYAEQLLQGSNIALDASYGPIPLDPGQGLYLVRGKVRGHGLPANEITGVQVFPDGQVSPAPLFGWPHISAL